MSWQTSDPGAGAQDLPVDVGEILAEKYRVEKILGAGGMGVVVAARHVELGEIRAIKFPSFPAPRMGARYSFDVD